MRRVNRWALAAMIAVASVCLAFAPSTALAATAPSQQPAGTMPLTDDVRTPPLVYRSLGAESATTAKTGDNRIDSLLSGYALSGTTVTYSFYEDDVWHGAYAYGAGQLNVNEPSEAVKDNVRDIMAWYSSVMNVDFVEVTETASVIGTVRIMCSDDPTYAYAYYPAGSTMFSLASDVHLKTSYDRAGDTNGFQNPAGYHGYMAVAHEIGHAIGLKHTFGPQGSYTATLPVAVDNTTNSIMTYTFLGDSAGTPMEYDLLTLHYMYGARAKNTGDDTYRFTSLGTSQYALGATTWLDTVATTKHTIWDTAGTDTLDCTSLPSVSGGYRIDLRQGGWVIPATQSSPNWYDHGATIANGSVIEDVFNSTYADTIYANSSANRFGGYTAGRTVGNDVIVGATAADTLDLPGYSASSVTTSRVGDSLKITLGARGSVTLQDYYTAGQPQIVYAENRAPVASFNTSGLTGPQPHAVTFTSTSSDPEHAIASLAWDFGDGASATGTSVSHTYDAQGTYTVTLTVTDSEGATDTAQATVNVTHNDAPVAADDAVDATEDALLTVAAPGVLANDDDLDGDPLTAVLSQDAAHGTVTLAADGGFTYQPDANFSGVDTFAYRASDGSAQSDPATVSVNVGGVADASFVLLGSTGKTLSAYGDTYKLAGTVMAEGGALPGARVVLQSAPVGGTYADTSIAATTSATGGFSLSVVPRSATTYRARVVDTTDTVGSVSVPVLVTPRAYVGTPAAPTSMSRSKYYTIGSLLKPRHSTSYKVRIYKWRKTSSGSWKPYGYVNAKVSTYKEYSKYAARMRLSTKGTWRLRAYAPADAGHAASWSSRYDYVKVR